MLTREMILRAQDFEKVAVEVPEWGGTVYVREMSGKARDHIQVLFMRFDEARKQAPKNGQSPDLTALLEMRVRVIAYCLCDAHGQLLFDDDEGRDLLLQKNGRVLERLYDKAMELNKITDEAQDEEKKDSSLTLFTASASNSV